MLEDVAHEEETKATDKSMIGDVWSVVIILIGAIKYHGDDR